MKEQTMVPRLMAGAATADITPEGSSFLFGYPHVPRCATGVHDRLFSSALFLSDGTTPLVFVANDVLAVSRDTACCAREHISNQTGISAANIMITATHTHSGPITFDSLGSEADRAVPKTDPCYVKRLEDGIVHAAVRAFHNARPAMLGLAIADGSCVGTHRHDPAGPSSPEVPVLVVRDHTHQVFVAAMIVCSMHPTVLHEDSTLVSGDFPAMTRPHLQEHMLGIDCPVVYHSGPCGNQSPRHVTKANTFDEAARLGHMLGRSIAQTIDTIDFSGDFRLACTQVLVELPVRLSDRGPGSAAGQRGGRAAGDASPVPNGSPPGAHGGVRLVRGRGNAGVSSGGR